MKRYLVLAGLLFLPVMASAAVVVVKVDQRRSSLPYNSGFDLDADGVQDFRFETSTIINLAFGGGGSDQLVIRPGAGMQGAYMGNSTLQPGTLLGLNLPVVNSDGGRGSWLGYSSWISSRGYGWSEPGNDIFYHFAKDNSEGYWGFRLMDEVGGWRYGYLHFQFVDWTHSPRGVPLFAGNPLVVGWALETRAETPIEVVPIPEGSVIGLLGGLLLAAGLYRSR